MSKRPKRPSVQEQRATQQRIAAQRALAAARGKRNQRLLVVLVPVLVVLVVVAVLVVVKVAGGSNSPKSGQSAAPAADAVIADVTNVPAATLDAIGKGAVQTPPRPITAEKITADGKPWVLYVGAEYCPYCAAERWAMVVALSRFGTFTGLGQTASSPSDVFANTATLSFHGSSYASQYLAFNGVETLSNQVVNGQYAPLDALTSKESAIVKALNPNGSIPFVDIGGHYLINGASYDPAVLAGKTHAEIAAALSDPSSPIAKAVDGTANVITAALCKLTADKPASVCGSAGVTAAAAALG